MEKVEHRGGSCLKNTVNGTVFTKSFDSGETLNKGHLYCIPDKVNSKVKHKFDEELYKKRNVVERFFCRLKDFLRITIRLDKLSSSFISFVDFRGGNYVWKIY